MRKDTYTFDFKEDKNKEGILGGKNSSKHYIILYEVFIIVFE